MAQPDVSRAGRRPFGLRWRSSIWFITLVVGTGIATDLIIYSIVIPVLPFQLELKGYTGVSTLVGYLLFAYSGGLLISTPIIAWISERFSARQMPLIFGLLALTGSQIMLMEAPSYWVMALARVIQGISSSAVWIVGLALLCDTTPEHLIGQQLGLAMSGLSLGMLLGPPIGGALYSRFGFRAPFVFTIIITVVDLIGRLLLIERKDALKYGHDPAEVSAKVEEEHHRAHAIGKKSCLEVSLIAQPSEHEVTRELAPPPPTLVAPRLSNFKVVLKLARSSRALVSLMSTLIYGLVYTSQEPTLPLHLQQIWRLNSSKVGLVFIAAVVPTLFSSPIAGYFADRRGSEWITISCIVLTIPWWIVITIDGPLALFITAYALQNLFISGVLAPLTAELALVARTLQGVGYAHIYGAFNMAYGIGSTVGPVIGSQMYEHIKRGWMALNLLAVGLLAFAALSTFIYTGERPLLTRLISKIRSSSLEEVLYNR